MDAAPPRRTVLVVDDDARNREVVRAGLSATYDVIEAENGRAALALLDKGRVDAVLLDVMMPELVGFATCREIRARGGAGFLPVILLTALDGQEDRNQGLLAGADEFLTKPIDRRELALRVRALVRVREQDERIRAQFEDLRAKEEQIRRQLEALRDLQALKDDLFSLIVHDLRNPLSGAIGFLELLEQDLADPAHAPARQNAEAALVASRKVRNLLDEALEVRRLEESGVPISRESVSAVALVRDAASTLAGAARRREVALEVSVEDGLRVWLDLALARRAIENLIGNAIKYAPARTTVSIRGHRAEDRSVVVEVADRGPGVSDTLKVQLFKKFGTLEATRSGERRRGFGLGLHLVKLVATAHGGDVFVRDHAGGGSVFGLTFPAPPS